MNWTTPADLRAQLQRRWERGDILRAHLTGEALFPLVLRLRKPTAREVAENFAEVAEWVGTLRRTSKPERAHGYSVAWQTQHNRVQGTNTLPTAITVATEDDALAWLGLRKQAAQFSALAAAAITRFPALSDWLARYPLRVLEHANNWKRLLTIMAWFQDHPRPNVYLRELDIPGVDSKFIERHRGILAEWLDAVLPATSIDTSASGAHGFNQRYGLTDKPQRVRLRLLDARLALHSLTDLAVPVSELAQFDPGAATVFITENEVNGLAFPPVPNALVVFGQGYAAELLQQIPWLARKRIFYWGDIDTHGFAILDHFRVAFPNTQSFLMDRATLDAHRALWGHEADSERFGGDLTHLTLAEQSLYQLLRGDALADALRLEQEQISQGWLMRTLQAL